MSVGTFAKTAATAGRSVSGSRHRFCRVLQSASISSKAEPRRKTMRVAPSPPAAETKCPTKLAMPSPIFPAEVLFVSGGGKGGMLKLITTALGNSLRPLKVMGEGAWRNGLLKVIRSSLLGIPMSITRCCKLESHIPVQSRIHRGIDVVTHEYPPTHGIRIGNFPLALDLLIPVTNPTGF